jgi:hypothetical protein
VRIALPALAPARDACIVLVPLKAFDSTPCILSPSTSQAPLHQHQLRVNIALCAIVRACCLRLVSASFFHACSLRHLRIVLVPLPPCSRLYSSFPHSSFSSPPPYSTSAPAHSVPAFMLLPDIPIRAHTATPSRPHAS